MDYLVSTTAQIPGLRLLRLWQAPAQPGETGIVALLTDDGNSPTAHVEQSDEVTPLALHPHDPFPGTPLSEPVGQEFLTTLTVTIPTGTSSEQVEEMYANEGRHSHRLGEQGKLLRLWKLPGTGRGLALWQVRDDEEMRDIVASLPLAPWLTVDTVPLSQHPNTTVVSP